MRTRAWFGLGTNGSYEPDCRHVLDDPTRDLQEDLDAELVPLLAGLRSRAPRAAILVVGYPPLAPLHAEGPCRGDAEHADGTPVGFGAGWEISQEDATWIVGVLERLNSRLAVAAHGAGSHFVDPAPVFTGHEACSADPWIRGVVIDGLSPSVYSFHPTRGGQWALAEDVAAYLRAFPRPPS